MGWAAFMCISPNVKEEGAMKEDTGTQDTPYTEVSAGACSQEPRFPPPPSHAHALRVCLSAVAGHAGGAAEAVCGLPVEVGALRAHR